MACACMAARRAARAVTQLYDRHLHASEVEATQFALLSMLRAVGPCSQAAISRRFALDKTTLSRNLKGLYDRGLIALAVAEDRRQRRYVVTPSGQQRVAGARPRWQQAQDQLRASMTPAQWSAMWKAFAVVTAAATAARDGVAPQRRSRRTLGDRRCSPRPRRKGTQ